MTSNQRLKLNPPTRSFGKLTLRFSLPFPQDVAVGGGGSLAVRRWAGRIDQTQMIQLVGPGGAGKTTTGAALAKRLGVRFIDLDAEFAATYGDISAYLGTHGYAAYAERNVRLYSDLVGGPERSDIVALSSGFMTYRPDVHPGYRGWRQQIASSPSTFVLLPSAHLEACVAETVRRQLRRRFAPSAEREEQVIRERFEIYAGLPARTVETMQPIETVVAELVMALAAQRAAAPDGTRGRPCVPLALGVS
jgi:shikimate kinase